MVCSHEDIDKCGGVHTLYDALDLRTGKRQITPELPICRLDLLFRADI
jgi:hypothetical protein